MARKPKKPVDAVKHRFCSLARTPDRLFAPGVGPLRSRAIIDNQQKWVNGTTLNFFFFRGPDPQKAAMRKAFGVWENVGIGIAFQEVSNQDDAHIRIGFENDGSWSYIGRTILTIPKSDRTMNIGWDITADLDTGVHEIGHTLGMPHEHQNPYAGLVWDEEKVYASLAAPPNKWDRDKTYWNIIRKIPTSEVTGTAWDPDSIMHYPFEAGLIKQPVKYSRGLTPAGGLSKGDREWIKQTYPPLPKSLPTLKLLTSEQVAIDVGGQANFLFKPDVTREFTFKTFGESDVVMVLYEEGKSGRQHIKAADDSGLDSNAEIKAKLTKGKTYSLRMRMMYKEPKAQVAVMAW